MSIPSRFPLRVLAPQRARGRRLSRRGFVLAMAGGCLLAPAASAATPLKFPLRVAYARMGDGGFARIGLGEEQAWAGMQTRLGGLVDAIEPLQPYELLGAKPPEVDGGASCAMAARAMAANAGFDQVILYAVDDGRKTFDHENNWLSRAFASVRTAVTTHDASTAEAHLLDVAGGAPLLSATSDAAPRSPVNLFDSAARTERETLAGLTAAMERRLQAAARSQYAAQASIAD